MARKSANQDMSAPEDDLGMDRVALGEAIRKLRKSQSKTLAELAAATGRSVSFISQLERGRAESTISDLRRLSYTLGVPLNWFFALEAPPAAEVGRVVRAASRRRLDTVTDGVVEEVLSPDGNTGAMFATFLTTIAPGAMLAEALVRDTEEEGYLVKGELEIWIDDQAIRLQEGDSFRIAREPYRWINRGATDAVVVWVISSPTERTDAAN